MIKVYVRNYYDLLYYWLREVRDVGGLRSRIVIIFFIEMIG